MISFKGDMGGGLFLQLMSPEDYKEKELKRTSIEEIQKSLSEIVKKELEKGHAVNSYLFSSKFTEEISQKERLFPEEKKEEIEKKLKPLFSKLQELVEKRPRVDNYENIYNFFFSSLKEQKQHISQIPPKLLQEKINDFINENQDKETTGLAISALLNHYFEANPDTTIEITGNENLNYIGYRLSRGTLKIKNVGDIVGHSMQGGVINVQTAGDFVGAYMQGGTINVQTAENNVGAYMQGGTIIAENVGYEVGPYMQGGEIYVGKYQSISGDFKKGKIYQAELDQTGKIVFDPTTGKPRIIRVLK